MSLADKTGSGLALGSWGAVTATSSGIAIAMGGFMRDAVDSMAERGELGAVLNTPTTGYGAVYHLEILILFFTLVVIGPLANSSLAFEKDGKNQFGLADFPN